MKQLLTITRAGHRHLIEARALLLSAALGVVSLGAPPALAAGGPVYAWPRCAPLCAAVPGSATQVSAIYLAVSRGPTPIVTVNAFITGPRHAFSGSLCYEREHHEDEPGCVVAASARARAIAPGVWWLPFHTPVLTRFEATGQPSQRLVRRYWFGVSGAGAEGARAGILPPLTAR